MKFFEEARRKLEEEPIFKPAPVILTQAQLKQGLKLGLIIEEGGRYYVADLGGVVASLRSNSTAPTIQEERMSFVVFDGVSFDRILCNFDTYRIAIDTDKIDYILESDRSAPFDVCVICHDGDRTTVRGTIQEVSDMLNGCAAKSW